MMSGKKADIDKVINSFLTDVASIRANALLSGAIVQSVASQAAANLRRALDKYPSVGGEGRYAVPSESISEIRPLIHAFERSQRSLAIASRGYIVSLVSQYDAFLSSLVRALFELQPRLIRSSKKTIEVTEVLSFSNMEDLREAIIDDEIESLLRESHFQQFAWLENKFELKTLTKDLAVWSDFIELTQRRNLFVHSDGRISKQYLKICENQGCKLEGKNVGMQLDANIAYVRKSADILVEISVKLSQVLWRKVAPGNLEDADRTLNGICYSLIEKKRYSLALVLLDFSFDVIKRYSGSEARLQLLINRANAYRLSGNKQKCLDLVSAEDWSAYASKYRLAVDVLKGNYSGAADLMRSIGTTGGLDKESYTSWPLFEGFRETSHFTEAFKQIFGQDELEIEIVQPAPDRESVDVEELLALLDSGELDPIEFSVRADVVPS